METSDQSSGKAASPPRSRHKNTNCPYILRSKCLASTKPHETKHPRIALRIGFAGQDLVSRCSRFFPTFSSIRFSVYGFMWSSLIHLDLSFVQGDNKGSICILQHVDSQLNHHHLLKRLFFPLLDGFCSFVKDQVAIGVWIHFWVFNLFH